jgi:hypothetical protein
MSELEKIAAALQDKTLLTVEKDTGINRNLLAKIKKGELLTARRSTVKVLAQYFGVTSDE